MVRQVVESADNEKERARNLKSAGRQATRPTRCIAAAVGLVTLVEEVGSFWWPAGESGGRDRAQA